MDPAPALHPETITIGKVGSVSRYTGSWAKTQVTASARARSRTLGPRDAVTSPGPVPRWWSGPIACPGTASSRARRWAGVRDPNPQTGPGWAGFTPLPVPPGPTRTKRVGLRVKACCAGFRVQKQTQGKLPFRLRSCHVLKSQAKTERTLGAVASQPEIKNRRTGGQNLSVAPPSRPAVPSL